jgi:hypothetical protein
LYGLWDGGDVDDTLDDVAVTFAGVGLWRFGEICNEIEMK